MDSLKRELDLLENLSKKISDLIYNNDFSQIPLIDSQRIALIKKIKESDIQKDNSKKKIGKLVESNIENIRYTQKKLQILSKNHNRYNRRLRAYSSNK